MRKCVNAGVQELLMSLAGGREREFGPSTGSGQGVLEFVNAKVREFAKRQNLRVNLKEIARRPARVDTRVGQVDGTPNNMASKPPTLGLR